MKPLKVLLVEDSEMDEELMLRQLAKAGYEVQSSRVQTAADMQKALTEHDWDIILSDYVMPGFSGLDALRVLKQSGREIPLIIISGTIGEDVAVEAMRVGVDDYLMKDNLTRLAPAIKRELENTAIRNAQKRAEEDLRRTEENLNNAQRITHIGSWETDLVNNQLFWSEEVYRIFGVSKDNFGATLESFYDFIHPEDRSSVEAVTDAAMSGKAPYHIEHRIIRPDGEERVVCEIGEVIFDEAGKPIRFIGTVQDITKRVAAEAEMRLMKSAFDSVGEGIIITDARNPDNPIIYANAAFENLTGYNFEEIEGQNCRFLQGTETNPRTVDKIREAIEQKTTFRGEILNYRKNGDSFWNELTISPVFDQSGQLTNFVGVQKDISERKHTELEKALLTAEISRHHERLNDIVANVPGVVWEAWGEPDVETQRIDFVSKHVETMLGYTIEEWISTPNFWLSIVHPEDKKRIAQEAAERFHTGEGYTRQFRWIARDGRIVWVESQATVIRNIDGQPIGLRGISIDITERRRLEHERTKLLAELASEKAQLQHIFDNSPSFIVSMRGPDFVFETVNPAYYQLVGQRNLIGIPAREALPELVDKGFFEMVNGVYVTGKPFVGNEVPVQLQSVDGKSLEFRYVNFTYMPLREADDSIAGIVSYGIDVTEQVMSRFKIQESEDRYRFLFDNNPLPMWVFDLETLRFLSVNEAAIAHYGYTREEFLTMTVKDIRPPEDVPFFLEYVAKDAPGIRKAGVLRHIKKDGTVIDVEVTTNQLVVNGKKAKLVLASDVTEQKLADKKIRESEERYRIIAETVSDMIITIDQTGLILFVNQAAERVLGYTPEELVGNNLSIIIPEHLRSAHEAGMGHYMRTGEKRMSWNGIEIQALCRNGQEKQIEISFGEYNETDKRFFTGVLRDITERKHAETALREAEDKYRNLVESSPAIIYQSQPYPPFQTIYVSPNITRFGYPVEEWINRPDMWINLIHKDDRERVTRVIENVTEKENETELEYRIIARNGTIIWVHDKGRFVFDDQGNNIRWQGVMLDITKTRQLEEQLRQAQKLESVGLLAGGIAHDFNNMLTAINGYSELTLRKMTKDDPLHSNIEEIRKAGQRSAELTHQLLAFSRQQILQPIVLDLNETIRDTMKMLDRLIGENIQLTTTLNPKIGLVKADKGQLSQIIMNLAVNARDAMPQGGRLTIETADVYLDSDYALNHIGVLQGAYIMLAVSDTGSGMSIELKEHIFEPFFTTKETGHGTGLGLATVYGIVKQSGGSIEVFSEESVGTTFKIYLPRVAEQAEIVEIKDTSLELSKGTETILLVEDEDIVRHLSHQILEECGYTVIEARNGLEALKICEQINYKFDLLITDVVMPAMGGSELSEILKTKLPDLKILFTSGYTDDALVRHGITAGNNFIQKPYTPEALADKIRGILDNSDMVQEQL